jgi:hypothetical protein
MARRSKYKRNIKRGKIQEWPTGADTPDQIAARVSYTGSPLHKTYQSPAGPPAWRSDKAKCDHFEVGVWPQLVEALRSAIRAGCVGEFRGMFPSRAWVWINDVLHEARLDNEASGNYHGFPINDSKQYPVPVDRLETIRKLILL